MGRERQRKEVKYERNSAHEEILNSQEYLEAELRSLNGSDVPTRSTSHNNHVILTCTHPMRMKLKKTNYKKRAVIFYQPWAVDMARVKAGMAVLLNKEDLRIEVDNIL